MTEEDFRSRLLTELAEEEPPPLGALVAGALDDGVRLRRRRRVLQVLGSTAGVAAVAVAATAVANSGVAGRGQAAASGVSGTAATTAPPAPSSPSPGVPATSKAKPAGPGPNHITKPTQPQPPLPRNWQPVPSWMTGAGRTTPPDGVPATARSVAAVLIDDLQQRGGTVTHVFATAPTTAPNLDGQYGADMFWNLSTVAVRLFDAAHAGQTGCPKTNDGMVCYDYKLADGTEVNYFMIPGRTDQDIKNQKSQANLTITYPDGSQTVVLELNGREQGLYGADRADLPLTEQQLWTLAADPRMGPVMDREFVKTADRTIVLEPEDY